MDTCIYQIVNTVNGKRYIGSAVSFFNRRRQHRHDLRHGKHGNSILQRAWNKYGETAFVFTKMVVCSKENLLFYEQRALDVWKPDYNICMVAGSSLGLRRSAEARARIGAAGKGRATSAFQKARASETHRGRPKSAEHAAKISAALAGRKVGAVAQAVWVGRKHRPESRMAMSAAKKGIPQSAERRLNTSLAIKQWWAARKTKGV